MFLEVVKKVTYSRLYTYLTDNNYLFEKQFGFEVAHSTDSAVIQLVCQILQAFNGNGYTIGIFIDLCKAFDTTDHDIYSLAKIIIVQNQKRLKIISKLFVK